MRISPRGNYIMMFSSDSTTSPSRSYHRTIGAVTIATALGLLFMVDTDEILRYSTKLLISNQQLPSGGGSPCPQCQDVWRPEYDYEADYEKWDKQYGGKVQAIRLLGERHSGTNWITDHLEEVRY